MRLLLTVLVCLLAWPALSAPPPDPMLATPYHGNVAVPDFLVSEKLDGVRARWDGRSLWTRGGARDARAPDDLAANTVEVDAPGLDPERLRRSFYTSSSCGVCGKGALEAVAGILVAVLALLDHRRRHVLLAQHVELHPDCAR